jgi:hypothetical protein
VKGDSSLIFNHLILRNNGDVEGSRSIALKAVS